MQKSRQKIEQILQSALFMRVFFSLDDAWCVSDAVKVLLPEWGWMEEVNVITTVIM